MWPRPKARNSNAILTKIEKVALSVGKESFVRTMAEFNSCIGCRTASEFGGDTSMLRKSIVSGLNEISEALLGSNIREVLESYQSSQKQTNVNSKALLASSQYLARAFESYEEEEREICLVFQLESVFTLSFYADVLSKGPSYSRAKIKSAILKIDQFLATSNKVADLLRKREGEGEHSELDRDDTRNRFVITFPQMPIDLSTFNYVLNSVGTIFNELRKLIDSNDLDCYVVSANSGSPMEIVFKVSSKLFPLMKQFIHRNFDAILLPHQRRASENLEIINKSIESLVKLNQNSNSMSKSDLELLRNSITDNLENIRSKNVIITTY